MVEFYDITECIYVFVWFSRENIFFPHATLPYLWLNFMILRNVFMYLYGSQEKL